jgi:hypothetical protein
MTAEPEATGPSYDEIAERAYLIHLGEQEGGDAVENWLRAERELQTGRHPAPPARPEELPDLVPDPMDRLPPSGDPVDPAEV